MDLNKGCQCTDTCKFYAYRPQDVPQSCPSLKHKEILEECKAIYKDESSDARNIWKAFAKLIHTGGAKKSRLEHVIDFCHAMDFKTVGIASCLRYINICNFLKKIFSEQGMTPHIALCKIGGFQTKDINIEKETDWIICNPLGQALLLNDLQTELNVTLGLCMGQELIFNRYSKGFVTNLIVKEKISEERPLETIKAIMDGRRPLNFHSFSD